jgi:hypothetical protein
MGRGSAATEVMMPKPQCLRMCLRINATAHADDRRGLAACCAAQQMELVVTRFI